jgi:hypothetical protein
VDPSAAGRIEFGYRPSPTVLFGLSLGVHYPWATHLGSSVQAVCAGNRHLAPLL